jgi:LPXTG-site transpeptidase (sortase) family protein
VLLRKVLDAPARLPVEDSLYHKLREEALQGQTSSISTKIWQWFERSAPTLARILANLVSDTKNLLIRGRALLRGRGKSKPRKEKESQSRSQTPKRKRSFIKELMKTGFIGGGTFAIAMIGMNWTAYSSITKYYIEKLQGTNIISQQQMAALVESPEQEQIMEEKLLAISDVDVPVLPRAGLERPPLTLDVTPSDNRIIIPKINKNVPIVEIPEKNLIKQNCKALEEDMQNGLVDGVVHYPGTAKPGQTGNFFVTGHSSFYAWTKSKYKDVFALLPELEIGDRVTVYYDQRKYTYEIISRTTVRPTDTSSLKATSDKRITIMTCWPIGTDLSRLIFVGKLVEG